MEPGEGAQKKVLGLSKLVASLGVRSGEGARAPSPEISLCLALCPSILKWLYTGIALCITILVYLGTGLALSIVSTNKKWQTMRMPSLLLIYMLDRLFFDNIKSGSYWSAVGYSTGK